MAGAIEDLTAAVAAQAERLAELSVVVLALSEKVSPHRETYTLADVAELPEAPSLKTLRNNQARQPRGGVPDGYIGSKKAWHRETVEAWRRELSHEPQPRGWSREQKLGGAA